MRAALLALASVCAACGGAGPPLAPTPAAISLQIEYRRHEMPPPDPLATGCLHHYAPIHLGVTTDWGATLRLEPGGPVFRGTLTHVPPGAHWLTLIDTDLCGVVAGAPYVTRGVRLAAVELDTVVELNGAQGLRFTVSSTGEVRP